VRTPFLYPDGDGIDLFLEGKAGVVPISDLGETLRWVRDQRVAERRFAAEDKLIEEICRDNGIERSTGVLSQRVATNDGCAQAITRVARTAQAIAGQLAEAGAGT
jgi:hypothetical protein